MKSIDTRVHAALLVATAIGALTAFPIQANAEICGFVGHATGSTLNGAGDDGKYEEATYTNCKDTPVKIRVSYYYADDEQCVSPGPTTLTVNPDLGALTGATEVGPC